MWVYVRVFGLSQWIIIMALLLLMVTGLHISNVLSHDESSREFGTKRGANKNHQLNSASSGFALVCLYAIQMGSHTNSKLLASRLLTLTISMLTFLLFAYYTTDITSEMTSGAADIPIRTFDDVVHYDYKVVTTAPYFENIMVTAKPGTAMNTVHNNQFELRDNSKIEEVLKEVINDNVLLYLPETTYGIISDDLTEAEKALAPHTFPLKMDDAVYGFVTLVLQNDSEFLQLFNHYILKAYETGIFKRLFHKHYNNLFTRENYEMVEPQPLGLKNVMFCFICLALGISLAVTIAVLEFLRKKMWKKQEQATSTGIQEERESEGQRVRNRRAREKFKGADRD